MQGSAEIPRPGWLTLRLKILLALIGVVLLTAGILLLVLERETSVQIDAAIRDAVQKSHANFQELENSWKADLASLNRRYARSTRILGALDAALEDGDPAVSAEAVEYEMKLDAISGYLFRFMSPGGRPICTLMDGRLLQETLEDSPPAGQVLPRDEPFGYHLLGSQVYAAHTESLFLFSRNIGRMMIGLPLRESAVQHLGERVAGQACFVVNSSAILCTPGAAGSALRSRMQALAGLKESRLFSLSEETWALFSELLNPQSPEEGYIVYAIPLNRDLAPFRRIRDTLILTTLATLAAAIILGFFLSRGLSAPVLELVKGTESVARGVYDFHIDISSKDELGVLGNAFNAMVQELFLREQYRNVLYKAVSPEIAREMLKGELFLGGENRVVTTLFADIRGFTAMSEGLDPREVIAMLNDFLEGASAAIEAEGGVVDKYVGDEVMAIFGAPVAHPDDAQRAVRAALNIQSVIARLNESRREAGKPDITAGIGINTGIAVAGNMGSRTRLNYTVLGETVNLAARLCASAKGGEILISRSTLQAVGPGLDVLASGSLSLKGLSKAVDVWAVRGWKTS